jgi:hypothetical protein
MEEQISASLLSYVVLTPFDTERVERLYSPRLWKRIPKRKKKGIIEIPPGMETIYTQGAASSIEEP